MFPGLVRVVVILPLTTVLGDKVRPYPSTWCLWVSFLVNWEWQQNRAVIAPSIAGAVYQTSALAFSDLSNPSFLGIWPRKIDGLPDSRSSLACGSRRRGLSLSKFFLMVFRIDFLSDHHLRSQETPKAKTYLNCQSIPRLSP